MPKIRARRGVAYGPGVRGKYQFRVREAHVAETYVPLLRAKKLGAVRRESGHRGRPGIIVQRDHGTGPFDDPDGKKGNSYITISGPVITQWLKYWGTPEVSAYLAAMVADRYAQIKNRGRFEQGGATWFETLDWFADPHGYRPPGHVRIGFAPRTLQRGLANLRTFNLVTWEHRTIRPDKPGHRFRSGRRNIYTNHFDQVDTQATPQQTQQPRRVATPIT
ncbi:MAG: hypothetical protein OXF41_02700 [bacterium]|nr:hypothetical protein [bacterium]